MYLDVGLTCGGVAYSFCIAVAWLSELKKCHQDCLISSAQLFYICSVFVIGSALTCGFSGNMPHLYTSSQHPTTSLHMIGFTKPSPAANVGVRRLGYEASLLLLFRGAIVGTWVRAWEQGYVIHFSGQIFIWSWTLASVLIREVSTFQGCPLRGVPL